MTSMTRFSKILVANRGEIALRVIRSARALGYRTVAVFSSADADAQHVHQADQAVWIGEALPAQSYLCIEAIVQAAQRSGADAVHPGYGFLAENAAFAQACRDAGLVFIGPSPESIRAMGDKAGAKRLMELARVPCIPGYQGVDQSPQVLLAEAARIGYPVMIKATKGGGGRGMRLVHTEQEFPELLRRAQSEASNAFGDGTVILERAIVEPRHIEIQVFGDRHGNAIHLGERDCSVQRRHQKVIEEAPSPAVDAALRERMGAAAVAAVRAIGYEGAGTLEFLLDRRGDFYFMEMNTRLQVEHPVTEAITGLDLVEWQLRVAAGEALPLRQEQVRFQGHAIEVRLCAEDAHKGFLPQSGSMRRWQVPAGIRVEHALQSGSVIPPYYDSMIAKLVAHGADREEARRRLLYGVQDLVALGLTTNQEFLGRCLTHPVFVAGGATTAFIARHGQELLTVDPIVQRRAVVLASWLLHETAGEARSRDHRPLTHALPVGMSFMLDGVAQSVRVAQLASHRFAIDIDGEQHALEVVSVDEHTARCIVDGVIEGLALAREGPILWLCHEGRTHQVTDLTRAVGVRLGETGGDGSVRASMNGRVVAVMVAVGQRVEAGEPVFTLEAMKMEHVHNASVDGVVTALHGVVGDQLTSGRLVAEIRPAAQGGATSP